MAQFGGDPVNFPEGENPDTNPRRVDPETPVGRRAGDYDPPNTGGRSQTEAVRLARRGGSVAPPISDPDEKREWIPAINKSDVAQAVREANELKAVQEEKIAKATAQDLAARQEGERARLAGSNTSDCPYSVDISEHYHWVSGWLQATLNEQEEEAQR